MAGDKRKQVLKWLGLSVVAGGLASGSVWAAAAKAPLKVAFVYVSPIGDVGYTYQHELGRRAMVKALGNKVQTKIVENVPEGPEAERVIRELSQAGYQLIFTTSFGYMNPTIKVAREFPNVKYDHATGYKRAKNVGTYSIRFYEGAYLAGVAAGKTTKTNKLGYIVAFPIPEVIRNIDAFTLGARSVNPKAQVKIIWTSAWFDPGKERQAANALIEQGCDVLNHDTDSPAVMQAAEAKHIHAIAYNSDMSKYGPHAQLTAVENIWGGYYTQTAKDAMDGKWTPKDVWGGIKAGMVRMAPLSPAVPKAGVTAFHASEKAIASGKLQPFQGPIKDQKGVLRVKAGQALSDAQLLQLNWLVDGVQGSIPK